ncbi:GNAT family N-acetyltransferase [Nocardioides ferulae]|uniref:GNAT family N-acetyltransferase n=1 Tax=Nocardioides ferulae TaxID=2340821 RepID=UPI000EB4DB7E|nr:GNAT family N-acetyltransferase [Nocardioides ferulae]
MSELRVCGFDDLDARTAYEIWRLRQAVFVVEQACPYPDLDGRDPERGTRHLLLTDDDTGQDTGDDSGEERLVGYLRLLDDGTLWRIGRVLLAPSHRGRGVADRLMHAALAECARLDPARDVVLDAQSPLARWYAGFGFEQTGPEYLEDDIPHVPMRRSTGSLSR